jgi:P27 family predicted phage terminase small subunit
MAQRGRKSAESLATRPAIEPEPARNPPPPPDHLSPEMKTWWTSATCERDLDHHHLRLLEAACGAWDRMVEARQAVAEHGLTFTSKDGDPRPRPEVAIERDARIAFARIVKELDLDPSLESQRNSIGWLPPKRKPWERPSRRPWDTIDGD